MPKFKRKTKEERKTEIQEAAKKVFFEKGFRNTTMEDVVKATSLSKGGVYQYYKNTKTILFDIMQNGNYLRYERTESIINKFSKTENTAEIMTQVIMAKLFDKVPEKKLYLMFLAEILYDKDYEALFFELEEQSLKLFIKNMHQNSENEKKIFKYLKDNASILFRVFNGILVMHELFEDDSAFTKNKQKIHDIIFNLVQNFLTANKTLFVRRV